jgi:hypothetical protein
MGKCGKVIRSGLTAAQKKTLVDAHNEFRRQVANGKTNQPPAANMLEIVSIYTQHIRIVLHLFDQILLTRIIYPKISNGMMKQQALHKCGQINARMATAMAV